MKDFSTWIFRIKDDEGLCQDFELNYEKYEVVGIIVCCMNYTGPFRTW